MDDFKARLEARICKFVEENVNDIMDDPANIAKNSRDTFCALSLASICFGKEFVSGPKIIVYETLEIMDKCDILDDELKAIRDRLIREVTVAVIKKQNPHK